MSYASNLPPGVTESMIPGNRPEDVRYEELYEQERTRLVEEGLGDNEIEASMEKWEPEPEDLEPEEPDWDAMPGGHDDFDSFHGSDV